MSEMRDKIANVIAAGVAEDLPSADIAARVIEAMREPTETMVEAGDRSGCIITSGGPGVVDAAVAWRAMIAAALS